MFHGEDDMKSEIWARIRRLFGERTPSPDLELVFTGWRGEERGGRLRPAPQRELLHPMMGWRVESREDIPRDTQHLRQGREPTYPWPAGK